MFNCGIKFGAAELRHLRYFLAIAEHSHFRIAAEELLVSQPTLSQQMKDLEKELGSPLFERAGRGVRLTQAGSLFADYARRAINVLEEGQAALGEFDEMLRGRLRIGAVQTIGTYFLPAVLSQFHRDYPDVSVRVDELSASEVENGVADGSLDLGISFDPSGSRELERTKLFDEQFVMIVGSKHPLASRKRIAISDLKGLPLCLLTREFCTRRMIDAAFSEAGCAVHTPIELTSVEGCLSVVQAGGPATILPQLALVNRKLNSIRIERPAIHRTVCLFSPKSRNGIRATAALHDAIVRQSQSFSK